jgi:hypothetical protein
MCARQHKGAECRNRQDAIFKAGLLKRDKRTYPAFEPYSSVHVAFNLATVSFNTFGVDSNSALNGRVHGKEGMK